MVDEDRAPCLNEIHLQRIIMLKNIYRKSKKKQKKDQLLRTLHGQTSREESITGKHAALVCLQAFSRKQRTC